MWKTIHWQHKGFLHLLSRLKEKSHSVAGSIICFHVALLQKEAANKIKEPKQAAEDVVLLRVPLYVCSSPVRRGFCRSAKWSSLCPSGRFQSGHWSQNQCRTSTCPATTEMTQYELLLRMKSRSKDVFGTQSAWIQQLQVVASVPLPGRRGVPPSLCGSGWRGGSWPPSESHPTLYWTIAWWAAGPETHRQHVLARL